MSDAPLALYGYFRSSAAWRVRIVLHLKGLDPEHHHVHLVRDGGEQHAPAYRAVNPQGLVPALVVGDTVLTQSTAICEYLEETYPAPPLLPPDPLGRARVRQLMALVACDIHPLNNTRVLAYLSDRLGVTPAQRNEWYGRWIADGFTALEALLAGRPGRFCHGDAPTLADAFLIPQILNARRYKCPLEAYPTLVAIEAACQTLAAFAETHPARQPDAEA
jgi:maleylpyruvate isomerase